jgi:cytochrome P450
MRSPAPADNALWRPPAPPLRSNLSIGLQLLIGRSPDLLFTLPKDCYTKDIVSVPVGRRPVFIVNHPETLRRLFGDDRASYPKSDLMISTLAPLLGDGVLLSAGRRWEHDRKMLEPAFMQMRLEALFPKMLSAINDWIERLDALATDQIINLESELSRVTADVMFRILFSQAIDGEAATTIYHAFTRFQHHSPQFNLRVVLASDPARPEPLSPILQEEANKIRGTIEKLLILRETQLAEGKDFFDFTQALIDARDTAGNPFSRSELIDQLAVFFLAGHETTASALAWCFFILSQQPDCLSQLRSEIDERLGDKPFTYADFKQMPITRAVFRESMRLYPPVAFLTRRALQEDHFGKLRIPKDSFIVASPWLVHRHHTFWSHADRFDPSRFVDQDNAQLAGSYMPFGLGPRACTGAMIAQLEATLILCEVLRRFSFEPIKPERVFPVSRVSVRSDCGIPVRLIRRPMC